MSDKTTLPKNNIVQPRVEFQWKVSEFRKDKRTGPTSTIQMSPYMAKMYRAMMRKWRP